MIALQDGITKVNFMAFIYIAFSIISLIVFVGAMEAFVLSDIYSVPLDDLGRTSGTVGFYNEVWCIISVSIWGMAGDKFGRRIIATLGYIQIAIALILYPNGQHVYPQLILIRMLFAQGSSAVIVMLTVLLADYVKHESLGKAAGLMGFASGLGALVAVFGLVGKLPVKTCISLTYYIVAIYAVLSALLVFCCMSKDKGSPSHQMSFKRLKQGILLAKKCPYVLLAYICGFMARSGTEVVTLFVSLVVNKYYEDNNLCDNESFDPSKDVHYSLCGEKLVNENKLLCRKAFTRVSIVGGIIQSCALLGAPIYGCISDKVNNPATVVMISAIMGIVSYSLFGIFIAIDPGAMVVIYIACLLGVSEIFMVISSQVLLIKEAMPADMKGTVAGVFSLFGSLGIMVTSYLGGWLFDTLYPGAPFLLASGFNIIIFAVTLYCLCRTSSSSNTMDTKGGPHASLLPGITA